MTEAPPGAVIPDGTRAIVFDLDDTLLPSSSAYILALRACGIAPDDARYVTARERLKVRLGHDHPAARNRLLYFKGMLEERGVLAAGALLSMMDRYERALEEELRRQTLALGRAGLLGWLAARYQLAVVTNDNCRTEMLKLRALDPEGRWLKVVVTSEEVGTEKPDLRPFRVALAALDLPPERCLAVGDDAQVDLEPALLLGMRACLTTEFRAPLPPDPRWSMVARLSQLEPL
jgi:HAD superfamily hydrolase (TIGR01549 family)